MDPESLPRKLAAILNADVAGYSRLTGADEDATHRQLSACLDAFASAIEAHRGTVVHYAGDAVLADFGTVADALACAASFQRDLAERNRGVPNERQLRFRVGINLGDVIVDRDDIWGEGVNVAARLEGLADAGGICISGSVYDAVGSRLDLDYEFMGEQTVKNIAKPVRAYRVLLEPALAGGAAKSPFRSRGWRRAALAVAAVALAGVASALALWPREATPPEPPAAAAGLAVPDKPSIAVLPFDNLSGDPAQDYFVDGISEDVITELARFKDLFVIARNSTFAYKGRAVNVGEVGRELGVRYVLEGSVRKAGNRVRVTAQLLEAASGSHVWAEKYDRELEDVFAVQDDITTRIVSVLALQIDEAELQRARRKDPASLAAYDHYLKGKDASFRFTRAGNAESRAHFEKAIELDPTFARAYASLAWTYLNDWRLGWSDDRGRTLDRAFELAQRAVSLDESDAFAHSALGDVFLWRKENDRAVAELERAVELNPNDADSYAYLAGMLVWAGRSEEALGKIEIAMRLNPTMPSFYLWYLGHASFMLGRNDDARIAFEELASRKPDFSPGRVYLAAVYRLLGRTDAAREQVARALDLSSGWSEEALEAQLPYKNPADRARILDGFRALLASER